MATENNSKSIALFSILALILLSAGGYLFYQNAQLRQDIMEKDLEFSELQEIHTELDSQYLDAQNQLESLKGDNAELNRIIDKQLQEIREHKNQISALIRDNKNYGEAREELSELRATVEQYVEQIRELEQENRSLADENLALKDETEVLTSSVAQAREENMVLQASSEQLAMEKEQLTETNINLSKKVDEATTIMVDKIDIRGFATKETGKDVRRRRARNVEKLNICFDTEVNQFASEGEEVFYIRIINPKGETIAVESAGSGTTNLTENDTPITYSTKLTIDYKHSEAEACLEWDPDVPFPEGLYAVEIYNKGFVAGHTTFKLR